MQKKYAILIFSKPPIPGLVKTRLTVERGGGFTQEQAAQFFKPQPVGCDRTCHVVHG